MFVRWTLIFVVGACSFNSPSVGQDSGALPPPDVITIDAPGIHDAPPVVDAPSLNCPADFVSLPGAPTTSRYKIYSWSQSNDLGAFFPTAETTCSGQSSHLAIADDANEASALAAAIHVDPNTPYFWDGLTDEGHEGTWLTVTSQTPSFLTWAPGQPNGGTSANCALMNNGLAYDWGCGAYRYPFACECE